MIRATGNLLLYVKQNFLPMFYRVPMRTRVDDALYQAQTDLLSAQHNAEHFTSEVTMLETRIERLQRQGQQILLIEKAVEKLL